MIWGLEDYCKKLGLLHRLEGLSPGVTQFDFYLERITLASLLDLDCRRQKGGHGDQLEVAMKSG